jgi:hypothetical protein
LCPFSERRKRFSLLFSSFPISKHVVLLLVLLGLILVECNLTL